MKLTTESEWRLKNEIGRLDGKVEELLNNYEKAKERLFIKITNEDEYPEEIWDIIPHRKIEDLVIRYYLMIKETDSGVVSALINHKMLDRWCIREEELHTDALRSAEELLPAKSLSLSELCYEEGTIVPKVLTYKEGRAFGSAALFYPGMMDNLAAEFGGDYFILPSSVHEVILVSAKEIDDVDFLKELVIEENKTVVKPDEVLSNSVYRYIAKEEKFVKVR